MPRGELQAVVGPPGSGKTTYIGRQVRRAVEVFTEDKVVVLSMTRAAAAAAAGAVNLPEHAISTLHSACFRGLGCPDLVDDEEKNYLEEWSLVFPTMALSPANRKAVDPYAPPSSKAPGNRPRAEYDLMRARRVPREAWRPDVRLFAGRFEQWKRDRRLCDFTDLIERAVAEIPTSPGEPAAIFIDEAQDHSALEITLIKQWASEAHTTVFVGDPFQSIYQWRGASPGLFLEGTATPITLARSYRLPRTVHAEAECLGRPILPAVPRSYSPRDADGMVRRFPAPSGDPENVAAAVEAALAEDGHRAGSVMFIATCGYMLEPVLKILRDRAIAYGTPYVPDDPRWNPLPLGRHTVEALFAPLRGRRFWSYQELQELANLLPADLRNDREAGAPPCLFPYGARAEIARRAKDRPHEDPLADEGDGLDAIIHYPKAMELLRVLEDAPQRLLPWLERHGLSRRASAFRFALAVRLRHGERALDEQPRLTVGTIHSVKGGEADHVIVWPAFSPAGLASPTNERLCVAYVGMTRARERLALFTIPPGPWRPW